MSRTRVGVDATSWVNRRGFGRFTRNLVRRMVELDSKTTYVLLIDDMTAVEADLPGAAEPCVVRLRRRPTEAASADSSRAVADIVRLTRAAGDARLDAFLFPSTYTYFPAPGIPRVVGIHDTIADDNPALTFNRRRARVFWQVKQRLAVRGAHSVFTVSEASRRTVAARFGLPPERIPVVSEAPDPVFEPRAPDLVTVARAAVGLRPGQPFVLYAGGISPHKSVETLVDAFAAVSHARNDATALVLVGDLDREAYLSSAESVRGRIREHRLGKRVLLPGFVSDETLAGLYSSASAVASPSLAEGFGLPAVEAAACGAPLVLTDIEAHRETMDGASLFFPPGDAAALTELLRTMLDDAELRADLSRRALAAAGGRTWDSAAERVSELLKEAAR